MNSGFPATAVNDDFKARERLEKYGENPGLPRSPEQLMKILSPIDERRHLIAPATM
jgi:hypothetical protein